MYHTLIKLFFFLAVTTSAAPRPANNKRQGTVFPDLSAYTYIYPTPGISWKYVFGAPGIPAECSLRQQAILIDAVQATEEFLAEASTAKDTDFAWQQFFLYVNPLKPHAKTNSWYAPGKASDTYSNIRNSIYLASQWASRGHPDNEGRSKPRPVRQVALRCRQDESTMCKKAGLGAYTRQIIGSEPTMIYFCERFWQKPTLNELVESKHTSWTMNNMISQEHLLAHEYMHAQIIGHRMKIIDVEDKYLPNVPSGDRGLVYGASRCHDYAWMRVPPGDNPLKSSTRAKVNTLTSENADSYAWFATASFFWSRFPELVDLLKRQTDAEPEHTQHTPWTISSDDSSPDVFMTSDGEYDEELIVGLDEPDATWAPNCRLPDSGNPGDGLNCATNTTPPPTETSSSAISTPVCGPYTSSLEFIREVNQRLDGRGGQECCSAGVPGCIVAQTSSRGCAVVLCADRQLCVDCARLANYVAGMIGACENEGKVGGSQNITETVGLIMRI